jgi:hypothetical protein
MGEDKIGFKFTWIKGMPRRSNRYLYRYIDGEEYQIDTLDSIVGVGKFVIFGDIQTDQRIGITEQDIEELRKFSVKWEKIR